MNEECTAYQAGSTPAVIATTPSYSINDLLNKIQALRAIIELQDREIADLQESLALARTQLQEKGNSHENI